MCKIKFKKKKITTLSKITFKNVGYLYKKAFKNCSYTAFIYAY